MARIPADIREYLQKHRKTKTIRWAIKYYNDNYIYTEWEKPSGKYVKKNTDKTRGFRKKNKFLAAPPCLPEGEEKGIDSEIQDELTAEEIMRELL